MFPELFLFLLGWSTDSYNIERILYKTTKSIIKVNVRNFVDLIIFMIYFSSFGTTTKNKTYFVIKSKYLRYFRSFLSRFNILIIDEKNARSGNTVITALNIVSKSECLLTVLDDSIDLDYLSRFTNSERIDIFVDYQKNELSLEKPKQTGFWPLSPGRTFGLLCLFTSLPLWLTITSMFVIDGIYQLS